MKTAPAKLAKNQGSILMIGLLIAIIIGIVLGSYLYLIRTQNISVMRSQGWNAALAMAEAGVEEALSQLNPQKFFDSGSFDWSANGWGPAVNGAYNAPNQ